MAHEILSVKLCELDELIAGLRSRIQMSEVSGPEDIEADAAALRRECAISEMTLRDRLRGSRAGSLAVLADSFDGIERIIAETRRETDALPAEAGGGEVERKLLFAEYELDFAMLAANRALLMSLEAIGAQLETQEKKEGPDQ